MKKFKQTVEKINESKGFVSVEYIIIAGVVVALGVVITYFLATKGRGIASLTGSTLDDVNSKLGGQNIGDGIKVGGNTSGSTSGGKTSGETDSNSSQTNKSKVTKGADGKYYQDGSPFTGVNPDDGKTYKNGDPLTGVSDTDGKYYKDGVIFTGTMDGKYYKDGVAFTGTMDGKYYKDGVLFTGTMDGKYYKDGELFTGKYNGKNYQDGVELTYTGTGYDEYGNHYTNGEEDTTDPSLFTYQAITSSTIEITGYKADTLSGKGRNVVIPSKIDGKTVKKLATDSFDNIYDDTRIESVVIPDTVDSIGDYAFYGNSIKSLTIPGSVKTIGTSAFARSTLESLTLNEGLETIGEGAFTNTHLTTLSLPSTIKSVGNEAFSNTFTYAYNYVDLSKLNNSVGWGASVFGYTADESAFDFWPDIKDSIKQKILN